MLRLKSKVIVEILLFGFALSSCYVTEKSKGVAYLRLFKSDSSEIELPYIIKGRGSLHNFTFEKFRDSSAHRIYIPNIQPKISSDKLTLIYKGETPQSNLKGELYMNDSALMVNFKVPRYNSKGIIKRWTNYRFNGVYDLKTLH